MYRELDRSTSGTDLAVSISVLTSRSRDSSRTEASRSVSLTVLPETVAVDRAELQLEKMELEVEVNVAWLEVGAMEVCDWEDTSEVKQWTGEMEAPGKLESCSEGILQIGW